MSYLTVSDVKSAIKPTGFSKDDYFEKNPDPQFDDLLKTLEKESRAVINNQLKGEGLEKESKVEEMEAPHRNKIQLSFPVQTVSKVEVWTGNSWKTVNSKSYYYTEQYLVLEGTVRDAGKGSGHGHHLRTGLNPLKQNSNSQEWSDRGLRVRVTYDRGFDTIPESVKQVQRRIIRRMLKNLRQEQNLATINPDDVQNFNTQDVLTEDIKEVIGGITQAREKYTML
jgi:hypothetical protein